MIATVIAHKHNIVTEKGPTNVQQTASTAVQRTWSNLETKTEKEQHT